MILFCGIPSEPPLARAIQAAEDLEAPHLVFNQRQSDFSDILLEHENGAWSGALWARETEWPLDQFTGVYTRLIDPGTLPDFKPQRGCAPNTDRIHHATFVHTTLSEWLEFTPCRVLNRAAAMASNGSKPYQMQWIQRAGFLTPPTLVTNEPAEARAFIHRHQRVIFKSASSVRSIVREWTSADESRLARLRALPTQFQARIDGTNIRVHVVGKHVFATQINTEAVDYRYAHRDGEDMAMAAIDLPDDIALRCIDLSQQLSLPFCGIDLMRTPDHSYYCFEVNPSPGYSFFEESTGQPISKAVVDYLSAKGDGTSL